MIIRPAENRDLDQILAIHNDAILNSLAIWTEETVDRADREAWLAQHEADGHPVIVADIDGEIAGYASYGPFRAKSGYRFTVENSVYVAGSHHGQGIGQTLMRELIALARANGLHVMVAVITADNAGSIRFHEQLGFETAGVVREAGTKWGKWLDFTLMQLRLADSRAPLPE